MDNTLPDGWSFLDECPPVPVDSSASTDSTIYGDNIFPEHHVAADWGRDGRIVFADRGVSCVDPDDAGWLTDDTVKGLWILDPATGEKVKVYADGKDPRWSPDQSKIMFVRTPNIIILDLETGTVNRITNEGWHTDPAWHPDGGWIAYRRQDLQQLWIMWETGAKKRPVPVGELRKPGWPSWHPIESKIVFTAKDNNEFGRHLFSVRPDGSDLVRLTERFGIERRNPSYSPDGRWIVYDYYDGWGALSRRQVFVARSDGSKVREITPCGGLDPSWSPDGRYLVYTKYLNTASEPSGVLWLVDVEKRIERQLTFHLPCNEP